MQDRFGKWNPTEVSKTPTISTTAYSTGQNIGGKIKFSPVVGSAGEGYIEKLVIVDKAQQESDLDLILFSEDPSNSTVTDQSTFTLNGDDADKVAGFIHVNGPSDYIQTANYSIAVLEVGLNISGGSSSVYGVIISRGSPTFGNADDLVVTLNGKK